MSLLSVMFAGMALQKSMSRLLRPAAEEVGMFEVFGDILSTTFTPIMEALMPLFEWFSDVMDKLGDGVKIVIGVLTIFLFLLGIGLALGGQLGLAFGGLSVQLAQLTLALSSATAAFTALAGAETAAATAGTSAQIALAPLMLIFWLIAGAILAIIAVFYYWEDIVYSFQETMNKLGKTVRMIVTSIVLFFGWLGDRISTFGEDFLSIFTDIWDWIVGIWDSITSYLEEKWDSIVEYFTK